MTSVSSGTLFHPFLSWLRVHGGSVDETSVGLTVFPTSEGGRGAIALKDIPGFQTLFSIPRSLTLSTRTSPLPSLFGLDRWRKKAPHGMDLDRGWTGLILCMMWDEANRGKWAAYLASLPAKFSTPMFWSSEELEELQGTSVVEKLGKEEAEKDYREKLLPAIRSRKDLFPSHLIPLYYTLEKYHIQGSRILSRSFCVEPPPGDSPLAEEGHTNGSDNPSSEDIEMDNATGNEDEIMEEDSESEDEEAGIVSMVPMADMLNARYGSENAKLFYEENELRMMSTKPIKAGEQIWNTYNDLPNAELLRRYGHVDLLPLPLELGSSLGNPGDIVELRADLIVDTILKAHSDPSAQSSNSSSLGSDPIEESKSRIDWWLEMGGEDAFIIEPLEPLSVDMISLIRLLRLGSAEWENTRNKGKPPKPIPDATVLEIVHVVLDARASLYGGSIEDDEALLTSENLSPNKKHAIIVRLGEKRVLRAVMRRVEHMLMQEKAACNDSAKRKGMGEDDRTGKKSRR